MYVHLRAWHRGSSFFIYSLPMGVRPGLVNLAGRIYQNYLCTFDSSTQYVQSCCSPGSTPRYFCAFVFQLPDCVEPGGKKIAMGYHSAGTGLRIKGFNFWKLSSLQRLVKVKWSEDKLGGRSRVGLRVRMVVKHIIESNLDLLSFLFISCSTVYSWWPYTAQVFRGGGWRQVGLASE